MASPPLRIILATALACGLSLTAVSADAASNSSALKRWSSDADFKTGALDGVAVKGGSLTISKPAAQYSYKDPYGNGKTQVFDYSNWTSPWVTTGFDTKTINPSWNADTPSGTWLRIRVRGKTATKTGSWDTVADWSNSITGTHRHSGTSQTDDYAKLSVDTIEMNGSYRYRSWQIQVQLLRPKGSTTTPRLDSAGAVASTFSTRASATSKTTMTKDTELAVPRYSQMIHNGQFPQYGGGGASWCSPTSMTMVLRYFKSGPAASAYSSWSPYADSFVDHAARYIYDYRYDAAGNWPFNTAYAGRYGLDAFVTRLNDLRDAEAFIKKGIPVVAAVKYAKGALTGSAVASSAGHLLVIVGFTKAGKVIVNDPAASSNSTVRRVYDRAQFERAWLGGSGGVSYIIHPASKTLPSSTGRW